MLQLEHLKTLCKALRGGGGGSVIVDEYKENGVKIGRNLNSNCRPSSSERTLEIRVQASGIPKSFCKEDWCESKQSSAEAMASLKCWSHKLGGVLDINVLLFKMQWNWRYPRTRRSFQIYFLKVSHTAITRETAIYRDYRNQERNGAGGPPTLGLQMIGFPYQTNLKNPCLNQFLEENCVSF